MAIIEAISSKANLKTIINYVTQDKKTNANLITGKDCLLGVACMFMSFAIMQNRVLAINGIAYKDMLNIIKAKK